MTCGIYSITHLDGSACYVGQSIDIERRWTQHRSNLGLATISDKLRGATLRMWLDSPQGAADFIFKIEQTCPENELNILETRFAEKKLSEGFALYNVATTGKAGSTVDAQFKAITDAAAETGLSVAAIIYSIRNRTPVRGMSFSSSLRHATKSLSLEKRESFPLNDRPVFSVEHDLDFPDVVAAAKHYRTTNKVMLSHINFMTPIHGTHILYGTRNDKPRMIRALARNVERAQEKEPKVYSTKKSAAIDLRVPLSNISIALQSPDGRYRGSLKFRITEAGAIGYIVRKGA
jgi:GIY-YIG catalytic domain